MSEKLHLNAGSKAAGAQLQRYQWMTDVPPRAAVVLAHGYAEHSGRYDYFAQKLNSAGIAVYAIDHWGHGKSVGEKGFVPAFSVFTDGVEALLTEVEKQHPGLPIFLIGHSMGGLIAASHLVENQERYAGAVLSGPAIKAVTEPSKATIVISRLLSKIAPHLGVHELDANQVSRDPEVVANYRADPLNYSGKMSARLATEMFETMAGTRDAASRITLPILLLHGDADGLTAPEGSQFLFDNVGSKDKQLKLYPGLYHEIFNEPERDAVIADVTGWIDSQLV